MKKAKLNILDESVTDLCDKFGIYVKVLNASKSNTIAFCTDNPKRRQFEVVFMENKYRLSWRFVNYTNVMKRGEYLINESVDPDYSRILFSIELNSKTLLNDAISIMLSGYSDNPTAKLVGVK